MHNELVMQIPHSTDHFGEDALDDADGKLIAVVAGYIKEVATWAVSQDN